MPNYANQRPSLAQPQIGLAALRKSHRMSQADVAKGVEAIIDKPFRAGSLSLIEGGHRGASLEILQALEQVFGLSQGDMTVDYVPSHSRRSLKAVGE